MSLEADIVALYEAGRSFLPQAAVKYGGAAGDIHATAPSEEGAFRRDVVTHQDGVGNPHYIDNLPVTNSDRDTSQVRSDFFETETSLGQMQPQWTELRNLLQDGVLARTRDSLVIAGQTLVRVAESYAATDAAAGAALDQRRAELDATTDPTYQPPRDIPEAPRHDDPQ